MTAGFSRFEIAVGYRPPLQLTVRFQAAQVARFVHILAAWKALDV